MSVRPILLVGALAAVLLPGVASAQRPRVATVDIVPADAQINVGQQQVFLANAYDRSNNPLAAAIFTFSSSNQNVAAIDMNGIAVGVSPGMVIITVRTGTGASAKIARATLTVVSPHAARNAAQRPTGPGYAAFDYQPDGGAGASIGLRVRPFEATLVRGEYLTLRYEALNANGELAERVPLLFMVDPEGRTIVQVDSVGVIRALGDTGTATVRVTVPNNPTVQPRRVAVVVKGDSVSFSNTEMWMPVGAVDTLFLIVPSQGGRPFNGPPGHFQFESSDGSKVRANPILPVITAVSPGTVQIAGSGSAYYHPVVTVHVGRATALPATPPVPPAKRPQ